MGGRFSRQKGCRAERALRDLLRERGYEANRVPLSGAVSNYKGDVAFSKEGKSYRAEVKSRKDSFKRIYDLWSENKLQTDSDTLAYVMEPFLVKISLHPEQVLADGGEYPLATNLPMYAEFKLTLRKVNNLQKLVGECDLLAIKDNNHPFLLIRYRPL